MYRSEFLVDKGGKYYIRLRAECKILLNLQIETNGKVKNFYISTSSCDNVYFLIIKGHRSKFVFSAMAEFSVEIHGRHGIRALPFMVRHAISNFNIFSSRRDVNIISDIFSMADINLSVINKKISSRLNKELFCVLGSDGESAFQEEWSAGEFNNFYSEDFCSNFADKYDACPDDGYIFMMDGRGLSTDERFLLYLWVRKIVGISFRECGPTCETLERNPGIGALVGGGKGYGSAPPWNRKGRLEKLLDASGITYREIISSGGPPPFMLIRKSALSALLALNFSPADLKNGLINARLLEWALPAMIARGGVLLAEPPKQKSYLFDCANLDEAQFLVCRELTEPAGRDVCLFVGLLNKEGRFTAHAIEYMRALHAEGILVQALGVATCDLAAAQDPGADICEGFAARENSGYDFALWATALKRNPALWQANSLFLVNDSVFVSQCRLSPVIDKLRNSPFDVTGITASKMGNTHLQSYFIHFKRSALENNAVRHFWEKVVALKDKCQLISAYEVAMMAKFESAGLTCGSLFDPTQSRSGASINPSIHLWREMLRDGYPFVKLQLLRDNPTNENLKDWKSILESYQFDTGAILEEFSKEAPSAVILR